MPVHLWPNLITEILLLLPVKSLLRFNCLSNSFRDEIGNSNFAQFHLKRSIKTRTRRKLIFTDSKDCYASDFDDGLTEALRFSNQYTDREECITEILGMCHGLILLHIGKKIASNPIQTPNLFLWNPTTREIRKLPYCPGGWGLFCGLGYDSASNDYKVVRFVPLFRSFGGNSSSVTAYLHDVWVLSLKSNSWKCVQVFDLKIDSICPVGFANGFLYCTYYQNEERCIKVGCFDLANEVFCTLQSFCSPNDGGMLRGRGVNDLTVDVVFLEGTVLMKKSFREAQVDEFYLPVVGEVLSALPGGNWSKAFTFEPLKRRRTTYLSVFPLAYSKDGACVLLHTKNDIFWYNMEKKIRHGVKFLRGISVPNPFCCYVIWESIISLRKGSTSTFLV